MSLNIKTSSYFSNKINKDQSKTLMLKISYGYKEIHMGKVVYKPCIISSGIALNEDDWDKENLKTTKSYQNKKGSGVNNQIIKIISNYENAINNLNFNNEEIPNPIAVKNKVKELNNGENNAVNFTRISDFINKTIYTRTHLPISSSEHWKVGTAKQYENLKNHIENYEENNELKIKALSWEILDEKIYWDFFDVINKLYYSKNNRYYRTVSIAKICKTLKSIYNVALEENIQIPLNLSKKKYKINPPSNPVHKATLGEIELQRIINEDVSHSKEFTQARN